MTLHSAGVATSVPPVALVICGVALNQYHLMVVGLIMQLLLTVTGFYFRYLELKQKKAFIKTIEDQINSGQLLQEYEQQGKHGK